MKAGGRRGECVGWVRMRELGVSIVRRDAATPGGGRGSSATPSPPARTAPRPPLVKYQSLTPQLHIHSSLKITHSICFIHGSHLIVLPISLFLVLLRHRTGGQIRAHSFFCFHLRKNHFFTHPKSAFLFLIK